MVYSYVSNAQDYTGINLLISFLSYNNNLLNYRGFGTTISQILSINLDKWYNSLTFFRNFNFTFKHD
jgi:hypothetical protein